MSKKFIVLSGKELIKILKKMGFNTHRIKGSHHILVHEDGRMTTIPVHKNEDISKGLLNKILKEDLKMTLEELNDLIK
jgi:predicted RNA binding protein YcfA (HicA-like mRNA interferase family)